MGNIDLNVEVGVISTVYYGFQLVLFFDHAVFFLSDSFPGDIIYILHLDLFSYLQSCLDVTTINCAKH